MQIRQKWWGFNGLCRAHPRPRSQTIAANGNGRFHRPRAASLLSGYRWGIGLAAHVQRPGEKHMRAVELVLKYLSGTYADGILYENKNEQRNRLWGWVDADSAADLDTRRSHTSYVLMLNGVHRWISRTKCCAQHPPLLRCSTRPAPNSLRGPY